MHCPCHSMCDLVYCYCTINNLSFLFFFFNDTATTEIYTLSLHDALPISACRPEGRRPQGSRAAAPPRRCRAGAGGPASRPDRKSTRLNSSHSQISYAVFCLKKKKIHNHEHSGDGDVH